MIQDLSAKDLIAKHRRALVHLKKREKKAKKKIRTVHFVEAVFWGSVGQDDCPSWAKRLGSKDANAPLLTNTQALDKLIEASSVFVSHGGVKCRAKRRAKYNRVKDRKFSCVLRRRCWVCGLRANVRHHIFQLQKGGSNHIQNMVPLCHLCHAKVHPWMEVEHPDVKALDTEFRAICG